MTQYTFEMENLSETRNFARRADILTIGCTMRNATETLDQSFLEMRWRCLSLAADLDRIERAEGGKNLLETDARLQKLRDGLGLLTSARGNRAEQVQLLFSDKAPPPPR